MPTFFPSKRSNESTSFNFYKLHVLNLITVLHSSVDEFSELCFVGGLLEKHIEALCLINPATSYRRTPLSLVAPLLPSLPENLYSTLPAEAWHMSWGSYCEPNLPNNFVT